MKLAMKNSNAGLPDVGMLHPGACELPLAFASSVPSSGTNREVMVRDITTIEGVRDNMLVGYGLVVGLHGTGDTQQTIFTVQTLANAMQKMGVLISPSSAVVKNVAAVFVTASLPPFARPGAKLDVTVASVGDAHSLDGGVLLMSALRGPDGQVYAEAQGPLLMGGYSAGSGTNRKEVNASNVGTIPEGAIIERDTAVDLSGFKTVSLLLHNPDFGTAMAIADAVNQEFHKTVACPRQQAGRHQRSRRLGAIGPTVDCTRSETRAQGTDACQDCHQRADRNHCDGRQCQAFAGWSDPR
jgi:flagellar P-ring protein FlgI